MSEDKFNFTRLPESKWPKKQLDNKNRPLCVWMSDVYQATLWCNGHLRLSINHIERAEKFTYKDGISWDDLQKVKSAVGYGDWQAVEIYPPDSDVIYDANVRHLWLMHHPLDFQWTKSKM